ncbi:MAG: hypothetical protein R3F55_25865 [Alphaproteobacteria bacterium]
MPIRPRPALQAAVAGAALLILAGTASAQQARWAAHPGERGACGDECSTPATAWVFEPGGNFAFGVQCGGTLVLGGPAMQQPTPAFDHVDMVIDGRSFGRFAVANGLNDVYVSPTGAGQDWAALGPALMAGNTVQLWMTQSALLEFSLAGSRAALGELDRLCAAETTAATAASPSATAGDWPTAPAFAPGMTLAQGAVVGGLADSGNGGWLGNRAADGAELWALVFESGGDGAYVVVTPDSYTADGSVATWRVETSLQPPADRQPPARLAWGPCRVLDDAQSFAFARWDGGPAPAQAWAFDPASASFRPLAAGAFVCEDFGPE